MHLTTFYHSSQTGGWKHILTSFYQHILCNVVMGWFSLAEDRERDWPFWSHFIFFMCGLGGIGGVERALQCSRMNDPYPTQ